MSYNILNICTVSGEPVKRYDGIKKYIATGDITNNIISSYDEVDYMNKPSRANQIAKIGEVIFAKMKKTVKVMIITEENSEYIYSTGFYIVKPKENVLTEYLYWLYALEPYLSDVATTTLITNKDTTISSNDSDFFIFCIV